MKIEDVYDTFSEGKRLSKSKAHQIEFITTVHVLEPLIRAKDSIIELGAGEGIYAEYFGKLTTAYYATDYLQKHVDAMKTRFASSDNVFVSRVDATQIPEKFDGKFDHVLCLGPYYHLQSATDRDSCISGCIRIAKAGGTIVVAYINKLFVNQTYIKYGICFNKSQYSDILSSNNAKLSRLDPFLGVSYFCTPDEIENSLVRHGLKVIDHLRTDGPYTIQSERIDEMDTEMYSALVDFHLETCREKSVLGMSSHGLVICRKS